MKDKTGNDVTTAAPETVHRSPHPGIVAVVFVLLFAASVAANLLMSGGAPYPRPDLPVADLQDYYLHHGDAIRASAFVQLGAMVPLLIYSATMVSRLGFHQVRVAGVHITLFGGVAAAVFLGVSALTAWTLSQPGVASDAGAMRVAQLVAFASGGFAHTLCLGLLLAGLSVPSLVFRLVPRWIAWAGLVIAGIAMLSILSMVVPALSLLLPLARFPAYLWLIAAGFALPKTRLAERSREARPREQPAREEGSGHGATPAPLRG
jgi:hypothetical protein